MLSLVLGTLAAWGLTRLRFLGRGFAAGLHGAVLVVPWLIIGVAGLIFFSELGVALSLQTIGLMHLVVTFPLVVAIVSAGPGSLLSARSRRRRSTSAHRRFRCCATSSYPQIAPSLAAAGIFAFAWSFNNFEISFFTGGFEQTFPVWVFSILRQSENLPLVNAVSTVIALAQVIAVVRRLAADQAALTRRRGGGDDGDHRSGHRARCADGDRRRFPARAHAGVARAGAARLRPLAFLPRRRRCSLRLLPRADGGDAGDRAPVRAARAALQGFTLTNFTDILGDELYRDVALTTFQIATAAMLIQLAVAIPLAYVLALQGGQAASSALLLFLVLADELNPMVRIYAWRMLLGREGLINEGAAATSA